MLKSFIPFVNIQAGKYDFTILQQAMIKMHMVHIINLLKNITTIYYYQAFDASARLSKCVP